MTDAERRPMQRMIAKGLDSHVRGMGGRRRAEATPANAIPSRKPCRGSSVWFRQNLRKPHVAERSLSFQNSTHRRARLVFEQVSMKSAFASQCWLPGRLPLKSAMLAGAALQCL